jgi:DNA-binding XRE family transcriptional regulator
LPTRKFSPERLRQLRRDAGLSHTALAYMVSRSEQTIYLWERGAVTPSAETLVRVVEALDCTLDDLYEEAEANEAVA